MRFSFFFLVLCGLVIGGVACSSDRSADGEWVLDGLEVDGSNQRLPDRPIGLTITGSELSGSSGCNSIGGSASFASNGSLAFQDLFWTEMACMPTSIMEFETTYTSALLRADAWVITDWLDDGKRLTFSGPGVDLYYVPETS